MIFGHMRLKGPARARSGGTVDSTLTRQLFAYEMLATRRNQQDSMMWQTPSLALTAEAFLLTIALGNDAISTLARMLAAGLGVVVAGMAMQLMAKHRHLAAVDNAWLKAMEQDIGLDPVAARDLDPALEPRRSVFRSVRSYVVWQVGLGVIALINVAVMLIAAVMPELL